MKQTILALFSMLAAAGQIAYAQPTLKMDITGVDSNAYYLCVYDAGCFSIQAGDAGKSYPISSDDMANLNKLAITNVDTMKMSFQSVPSSCGAMVGDHQQMTVSGHLVVHGSSAHIQGLYCSVR